MRTIVVAGAHSNVGKTTVAGEISKVVKNSVVVKIGNSTKKRSLNNRYYPLGTPFSKIKKDCVGAETVIVESNSILQELKPNLLVYLTGKKEKKPSAKFAKGNADIVRGRYFSASRIKKIVNTSGYEKEIIERIIILSGGRIQKMTAIILAGGKSTRMGRDKASLEIDGVRMVDVVSNKLNPYFDELVISCAVDNIINVRGAITVVDREKEKGPLMGIYSALRTSSNSINFVTACDMPEVSIPLITKLISELSDYDIATPSFGNSFYEPMCSVYRKKIIRDIEGLLRESRRNVSSLFDVCKTNIVRLDPDVYGVRNINTSDQFEMYLNSRKD